MNPYLYGTFVPPCVWNKNQFKGNNSLGSNGFDDWPCQSYGFFDPQKSLQIPPQKKKRGVHPEFLEFFFFREKIFSDKTTKKINHFLDLFFLGWKKKSVPLA